MEAPQTDKRNRSFTDGAILEHGSVPTAASSIISIGLDHTVEQRSLNGDVEEVPAESNVAADTPVEGNTLPSRFWLVQENARLIRENSYLQQIADLQQTAENQIRTSWSLTEAAPFTQEQHGTHWATSAAPGVVHANAVATAAAYAVVAAASAPNGTLPTWFVPMLGIPSQRTDWELPASQDAPSSYTLPYRNQQAPPDACARTAVSLANSVRIGGPTTDQYTTVMLRNLPNSYTRQMLVDMLHAEGFGDKFNFVYLPIDFKTHGGLGYAFVNLTTPAEAERMRQRLEGLTQWALPSEKVCNVSWSHPGQQGFAANVARYRNSPIMHESVPDGWKPALFSAGVRVPFPPPTRKLRVPRIRTLP